MRVAFLDIDGVLNSKFWNDTHTKEISDCTKVDIKLVELLGQFVKETGVRVVMHSAWRLMFDSSMRPIGRLATRLNDMLQSAGIFLYDGTPDFSTEEIRKTKAYSTVKASEILAWLSQHNDVTSWVVFEDLDLGNAVISAHQVKTDNNIGLTREDICKAKEILEVSI